MACDSLLRMVAEVHSSLKVVAGDSLRFSIEVAMICGHERASAYAQAIGFLLGHARRALAPSLLLFASIVAVGCDNGNAAIPSEEMTRRQWELSVQQNRRDMEKVGIASTARSELAAKDREIARLQTEVEELRERIVNMEREAAHDGRVLRVDYQEGVVWIDRGESDGLTLKQVFQVLPANGQADPRLLKSDLEVVRLLGPHLAEARIVDSKARAVMVGDRLHSKEVKSSVTAIPEVNLDEGEVLSFEVELEMVEISMGTRAGLVKGERLHVYREGTPATYVGQVQVLNAAPNKAFAQIVGGAKQAEVKEGDRVCKRLPPGLVPAAKARVE